MPTTSNFGWTTPADTDLVKDGAAAIRTLGNGIDTSLVDLKGGTTGQILSKASNADLDYTWINNDQGDITEVAAGVGISGGGTSGAVTITNSMATAIDAKGDLVAGTGADAFARLAVGANNTVLTADSSTATGLKWAAPSTGALVFINRNSFTNVAGVNIDNVFSSTYKSYLISIENISAATATDALWFQFRYGSTTQTSSYWGNNALLDPNSATWAIQQMAPNNQLVISRFTSDSTNALAAQFYCNRVGNASERAYMSGISHQGTYFYTTIFGGTVNSAQTYTGFRLSSSSTNITGTVTTYGLATA